MNNSFSALIASLDEREIKYTANEEECRIKMGFKLDNTDRIDVLVFVDEDGSAAGIRCWGLCKAPAEKQDLIIRTCNDLNNEYRWIKFCFDTDDLTVDLAADVAVTPDNIGTVVGDIVSRMIAVADEAFPVFMRAIWC